MQFDARLEQMVARASKSNESPCSLRSRSVY